jgi:predicted DNA-binding protein (UPF0251 family)
VPSLLTRCGMPRPDGGANGFSGSVGVQAAVGLPGLPFAGSYRPSQAGRNTRRAKLLRQAFTACSLDASLSYGDDPGPLADVLGEDDPAVAHATDIEAVRAHLDELPERDQRILMLRFYGNLTQEQIGDRLGISQMHVSRLLDRALTYSPRTARRVDVEGIRSRRPRASRA